MITYYTLEYTKESIFSIIDSASEPIELTLVDSKSSRSDEIAEWAKPWVDAGVIKRLISASTNCKGKGLVWAYKNFPPQSDMVVLTDGDIVVPKGLDWIAELREGLKKAPVAGFPLDLTNFVPPNTGDPTEQSFGTWLMGIDREMYSAYVQIYDYHLDQQVLNFLGRQYHRSLKPLLHLGFNTWRDHPDLWAEKVKGTFWWDAEGTPTYTIYEL